MAQRKSEQTQNHAAADLENHTNGQMHKCGYLSTYTRTIC